MKHTFLSLVILFAISIQETATAQGHTFMSYNIRYNNPNDGANKWDERKSEVVNLIDHYEPLVFGLQEALLDQVVFIRQSSSTYDYIGVGRDDGQEKGEFSPIFYNKEKLNLLKEGTFWLSETPDRVSKDWDAALPRICTYGQFQLKDSKATFWFFNTHFDHRGKLAREKSATLIIEKIKALTQDKAPIILTGDFNAIPDSKPIQNITNYLSDGFSSSQKPFYGPIGTFSGFDTSAKLEDRIDYIFFRNATGISLTHIDDRRTNGLWVSDHLPVLFSAKF
ncbi:endonuclease/exonuclease/phosphatase family protein [Roseivirga misakiensis]|uniref:Endonuclease/exonuclease/phosphatase n=1 Tax=Roseivirga misakiensis TaxID=1563681 RepID=A0A1E5SYY5_9BACT|nr:endonuclease/exonuclease/phosphatase family protein [Roseivirga misakiensis]OEK04348.1 endonuclease/exonuclease/phosphatase [Roseivirga misakiensis]